MTTSSKRLNTIMNEIQMVYIDSQNLGKKPVQLEKKIQNYTQGTLLINEASELIEALEHEIQNLNMAKADKSLITKVNEFNDLLSRTNPRFDEVMYIVDQLRSIDAGLPINAEILNDIEQEIIYEEELV